MRTVQLLTFQSLRRVLHYVNDNTAKLGPLMQTPAGTTLADAITRLEAYALEQSTTKRQTMGDTNLQRALAVELRSQHMRPIAVFARANMSGVPEYKALVASGRRFAGEKLTTMAYAMAAAAQPYAPNLIEAQFPSDVIESLVATADAVKASIDARSIKAGKGAGATQGIAEELSRGRRAVATLDAVVTKLLAGDAAQLAEWRAAKRVVHKAGARREVEGSSGASLVAKAA
jgi:hypothetical protein